MLFAQKEHFKHTPCQSCCCEVEIFAERNLCRPRVITYRGICGNLYIFAEGGTRYREITTLAKRATYASVVYVYLTSMRTVCLPHLPVKHQVSGGLDYVS